jgi:hypothetical protein
MRSRSTLFVIPDEGLPGATCGLEPSYHSNIWECLLAYPCEARPRWDVQLFQRISRTGYRRVSVLPLPDMGLNPDDIFPPCVTDTVKRALLPLLDTREVLEWTMLRGYIVASAFLFSSRYHCGGPGSAKSIEHRLLDALLPTWGEPGRPELIRTVSESFVARTQRHPVVRNAWANALETALRAVALRHFLRSEPGAIHANKSEERLSNAVIEMLASPPRQSPLPFVIWSSPNPEAVAAKEEKTKTPVYRAKLLVKPKRRPVKKARKRPTKK